MQNKDNILIAATANKHKLREIGELLKGKFKVVSAADMGYSADIEETGSSFEENARIKADTIYDAFGLPVIADDSGLTVNALGGAPGVYSARYAGEEHDDDKNNAKLLQALSGAADRSARFVTCVVYRDDRGTIVAYGSVDGVILTEKRGTNGFGYDPIFFCNELNKTFGEATDEEKNSVSHRSRALKALIEKLWK